MSDPRMVRLRLPYPPSANRLYRRYRGRVTLSAEVRRFRQLVGELWFVQRLCHGAAHEFQEGPLSLTVAVYPPDRRRRDIDNILKILCDALQHARIIGDDSQFRRICLSFKESKSGGELHVEIRKLSRGGRKPDVRKRESDSRLEGGA